MLASLLKFQILRLNLAQDKFSKIGFILAVAGSAVGLGNAWKFPYLVGQNGGSAFVLLYLFMTFFIGLAIFFGEIAIGKLSESDPVNAFKKLAPKHKEAWKFAGFTMIGAIIIASFYTVIIGWILKYAVMVITQLPKDVEASEKIFGNFYANDAASQIFYFTIVFFLCIFIVSKGIKSGIERVNVWMMPSLLILLIIMLSYSFTMDGFVQSAKFLLVPDFSKLGVSSILTALGLAFFTLSLGVGVIIVYSASLPDNTNLVSSSIIIVVINVVMGILMGLVIFTFVFEFGATPSQGVGLVFISLPTLFAKLGALGHVLAFAFFSALLFAGITSAISMLEPFTHYLIREFGFSRKKALALIGAFIYCMGILCILSSIDGIKENLVFFGKSFFDCLDFLSSNIIMPIGGITVSIFVGFVIKKDALYILFGPYMSRAIFEIWYFMIRFVAPISIVIITINALRG